MTDKKYRVIKNYYAHLGEVPFVLKVGTILDWWDERGFYLSEEIDNHRIPVHKWAVESWSDYFEKVEAE